MTQTGIKDFLNNDLELSQLTHPGERNPGTYIQFDVILKRSRAC